MNAYYLGIDLGTTAVKSGIFDSGGRTRGLGSAEYTLETPAPDIVELDCEVYFDAVRRAVQTALATARLPREAIRACGITGQVETLIVLDAAGRPLRKAIVKLDNRARSEAADFTAHFGADAIFRLSGETEVLPCFPGPKIRWLARREPEIFRRAAKFLMVEDYIVWRLSGKFESCTGLWPSSCFYDLQRHRFDPEVLAYLQITPAQLPGLHAPGALLAYARDGNGILAGGTIIAGAPLDHAAGALGAGCGIAPGVVSETIGCTLAICAPHDGVIYDSKRRISTYEGFAPGQTVLLPWAPAAGMLLRYFRDNFAGGDDYDQLGRLAAEAPPGSDGLVILPHAAGAVSPEVNPAARAVAYGITLAHTRAHWSRAIMESVAYLLRDNFEALRASGCRIDAVRATGGASHSRVWLQIISDVLALPLAVPECTETTALGSAMLGAVAAHDFADTAEAAHAMTRLGTVIEPNPRHIALYDHFFKHYQALNALLLPTFGGK